MSDNQKQEHYSLSMMYGTYADILFVLFPFLVIAMQRLWDGNLYQSLMRPDLSIAAAILAGLAIGKFVLGLVTNRDLGRYKERIVFFYCPDAVRGPWAGHHPDPEYDRELGDSGLCGLCAAGTADCLHFPLYNGSQHCQYSHPGDRATVRR